MADKEDYGAGHKARRESETDLVVGPRALVIFLTPEHQDQAKACVASSEGIKFEIRASAVREGESAPSLERPSLSTGTPRPEELSRPSIPTVMGSAAPVRLASIGLD